MAISRKILAATSAISTFAMVPVGNAEVKDPQCSKAFAELRAVNHAAQSISEFRALDILGHPTVALDASTGTIEWMTPKAQQMIQQNFGPLRDPVRMPDAIQEWLQRALPEPESSGSWNGESVFSHANATGEVKLQVRGRLREDGLVLVGVREFSRAKLFAGISEKYGLTSREAEVFYWLAMGKTNPDIGTIVGAATGTVKKHTENIFRKLGLSNRTQPTQMLMRDFPESMR